MELEWDPGKARLNARKHGVAFADAVAALEDHIASIDDALNDARLSGGAADVARLERARALLVDSYTSVRYAEMVNANF